MKERQGERGRVWLAMPLTGVKNIGHNINKTQSTGVIPSRKWLAKNAAIFIVVDLLCRIVIKQRRVRSHLSSGEGKIFMPL